MAMSHSTQDTARMKAALMHCLSVAQHREFDARIGTHRTEDIFSDTLKYTSGPHTIYHYPVVHIKPHITLFLFRVDGASYAEAGFALEDDVRSVYQPVGVAQLLKILSSDAAELPYEKLITEIEGRATTATIALPPKR